MEHVAAILGLGLLCGAWVLAQRFFARHDPEAPGVEGRHGCRGAPRDPTSGP